MRAGVRRALLGLLPKLALSRLTGLATRLPVPRRLRPAFYGWFARRYGADPSEMQGAFADHRSLASFFQRPLRVGARPLAAGAPLVWPCDGRVVTTGAIEAGRIPQVKGRSDYAVAELVGDDALGAELARTGSSQATVYLAPGDYHRVHSPFAGELLGVRRVGGTLFPVNPPAVRCVDRLFVRNARTVFEYRLDDGRAAAVVMVGALNVGDVHVSVLPPVRVEIGVEIGRFGFGSTTVVLLGPGVDSSGDGGSADGHSADGHSADGASTDAIAACPPELRVRFGEAVPLSPQRPSDRSTNRASSPAR